MFGWGIATRHELVTASTHPDLRYEAASGGSQPDPGQNQGAVMAEDEVYALPVVVDLPTAARALGLGRSAAYELVRAGQWPTPIVRLGRLIKVPAAVCSRFSASAQHLIKVAVGRLASRARWPSADETRQRDQVRYGRQRGPNSLKAVAQPCTDYSVPGLHKKHGERDGPQPRR